MKLDPRKKTAVVAIGQMQWDVAIDELIPQVVRTPEVPEAAAPGPGPPRRSRRRLEDFRDERLALTRARPGARGRIERSADGPSPPVHS